MFKLLLVLVLITLLYSLFRSMGRERSRVSLDRKGAKETQGSFDRSQIVDAEFQDIEEGEEKK